MNAAKNESRLFMVPARNKDLEPIKQLLSAADLPCEDLTIESLADFCVALQDGDVIGLAGMEMLGAYGLLRSVVVDPACRSRGIGRQLVEERLEWAARFPLKGIYLLTTAAADYFVRFGFKPVERDQVPRPVQETTEFRQLCPESATVMIRQP